MITITIDDDKIGIDTEVDRDNLVVENGEIKISLGTRVKCKVIYVSRRTDEVELTNWTYTPITTLSIDTSKRGTRDIMSIKGIGEHPTLEEFDISGNFLRTLVGFEFCHRLNKLDIQRQPVADLSPIKELRLTRLNITGCPVNSMKFIPYESLEILRIDMSQLELLMREEVDLTQGPDWLIVLAPQCARDSLTMRQFLERYPNMVYNHCDGRRLNVYDPDVVLREHHLKNR